MRKVYSAKKVVNQLHVAVYVQPDSIKDIVNESGIKYQDKPIFHKGELTFGTFLGLCTGYLVKKVGKIFALFVGTGFVFLQVSISFS